MLTDLLETDSSLCRVIFTCNCVAENDPTPFHNEVFFFFFFAFWYFGLMRNIWYVCRNR